MKTLEEIADEVAGRYVVAPRLDLLPGYLTAGVACEGVVQRDFSHRDAAQEYYNDALSWMRGCLLEALSAAATPPSDACEVTVTDILNLIGEWEDVPGAAQVSEVRERVIEDLRLALDLIGWQARFISFLRGGEEALAYHEGFKQGFAAGASAQRDSSVRSLEEFSRSTWASDWHTLAKAVNLIRNSPPAECPP